MHSRILPRCKQSFSGNKSVLTTGKAKLHSTLRSSDYMSIVRCYSKTFPLIRQRAYSPITFVYCWGSNFAGKVVLEREHGRQDASPTLCIILYGEWIWANYDENSLEYLLRKQQLYNCRVASYFYLYFLFPTNFRSVFLPNTRQYNHYDFTEPYYNCTVIEKPTFPNSNSTRNQVDRRRTTLWMCYLQIVIYLLYLFTVVLSQSLCVTCSQIWN